MRLRHLTLALGLFVLAASPAMSADLFNSADTDGCQSFLPYMWVTLEPGEVWQATADLTHCTPDEMGTFMYYAYIASPTHSRVASLKDKVVLTVTDDVSGEVFTFTGKRNSPQRVLATAYGPCKMLLTAENTGRSAVQIRTTWAWMSH